MLRFQTRKLVAIHVAVDVAATAAAWLVAYALRFHVDAIAWILPVTKGVPDLSRYRGSPEDYRLPFLLGQNTTLAVVATDAPLTKAQAKRLAIMAQDGLARALRPAHTPLDGDLVFALALGDGRGVEPLLLLRLGAYAADALARAIARGVLLAEGVAGVPAYRERVAGGPSEF